MRWAEPAGGSATWAQPPQPPWLPLDVVRWCYASAPLPLQLSLPLQLLTLPSQSAAAAAAVLALLLPPPQYPRSRRRRRRRPPHSVAQLPLPARLPRLLTPPLQPRPPLQHLHLGFALRLARLPALNPAGPPPIGPALFLPHLKPQARQAERPGYPQQNLSQGRGMERLLQPPGRRCRPPRPTPRPAWRVCPARALATSPPLLACPQKSRRQLLTTGHKTLWAPPNSA